MAASTIGSSCKFFQIGRRRLIEERLPALVVDLDQLRLVIQAASLLKGAAAELGFLASQAAAERLGEAFDRLPPAVAPQMALSEARLGELVRALEYVLQTFRDEADALPMFILPPGFVALLEQAEPAFGVTVEDAFPSSAEEIAEAARCPDEFLDRAAAQVDN